MKTLALYFFTVTSIPILRAATCPNPDWGLSIAASVVGGATVLGTAYFLSRL
jgi:hypothetical protein